MAKYMCEIHGDLGPNNAWIDEHNKVICSKCGKNGTSVVPKYAFNLTIPQLENL